MTYLKHVWFLLVLLALAACGQQPSPAQLGAADINAPSISSTKKDYAPGEWVALVGHNWLPNELVRINVDENDGSWSHEETVTADEAGALVYELELPNRYVPTYTVTATGEASGTATSTFTDDIARGDHATNSNSDSGVPNANVVSSQLTINAPAVSAGDILVAQIVVTGGLGTTDRICVPSGWTSILRTNNGSAPVQQTFYRIATANQSQVSYTWAFRSESGNCNGTTGRLTGKGASGGITRYSGVDIAHTSGPIVASGNASGSGTSITAPSVTATAQDQVIRFFGTDKNQNITTPATTIYGGTTTARSSANSERAAAASDALQAANGATNTATATPANSANWVAQTVVLRVTSKVNTTTTLASSPNPSTGGQSVTFTATVTPGSGTNWPTGTVTFKNGTTTLGTGTLAQVGTTNTATATFNTTALAVGSHSITAEYGGVAGFNISTSAALTQQINAACTAPSIATQPASVTATVGGAATFSVTAGGTAPLSYQWLKGSNDIQGATSASYDLTSVTTTDAGNYSVRVTNACGTVTSNAATLTVNKAQATISLGNLDHTYDGSAKAATATTTPGGLDGLSISYSQNGNAVSRPTNAGSYAVVATLDNASHSAEDATGTLVIGKADQTISWDAPAAITYGAELGDDQLNATRTTGDGALTYDPPARTVLGAGTRTLKVTAAETVNYKATSKEVTITVNKAEQAISWSNPAAITYDTPLSDAQLNATLTKGDGGLTYSPAAGATLSVGTHTLKVTAAETANYKAASAEVSITVNKVNQVIAWNDPAAITYGTPLSATQLNASLTKGDGDLTYSPAAGTLLNAGTHTLTVNAAETANSYAASKQVSITVNKANQAISFTGAPSTAVFGSRFTVNATGGASGQPVGLAASGACTISGNEVTMTSGTGTCSLTANQAGDDNYNAAPQATQSTTAQKATATVTLGDLNYVFDGTAKTASATTNPALLNVSLSYSPSNPLKVGSYSVNATINDQNYQGSASGTLIISAWTLRGFYSPVDMSSTSTIVWNTVKNGSTVPLKFNVFAGATERTSTADIQGFSAVKVSCSATGSEDAIEEFATTGGTSLRYSDGQFIQNWATPKAVNTCYKVTLTTKDASTIIAYFKLK